MLQIVLKVLKILLETLSYCLPIKTKIIKTSCSELLVVYLLLNILNNDTYQSVNLTEISLNSHSGCDLIPIILICVLYIFIQTFLTYIAVAADQCLVMPSVA